MASELNYMSQVLNEKLRCQLCKNGLSIDKQRWYKCLTNVNHHICQDCGNKKPPQSSFQFGTTKSFGTFCCDNISKDYCVMTEQLLKAPTMQFKCAYYGCEEINFKDGMLFHQNECIYRLG